jgi:lipopolysaccharide biosynthesis protein
MEYDASMNGVNQLREPPITSEVDRCFNDLLEKQLKRMLPLNSDKEMIARRGLAAIYMNIAKALHAHYMGRYEEELNFRKQATGAFDEMSTGLETAARD